jgi:uncharacterized protein YndB with AHSA1/START domain
MLKIAGIAAVVVFVAVSAVLAYAATRPDTFSVRRSATIMAPPDKIFPLIDDFRAWAAWSPYEKKDPAMKKTFGGAAAGKGAVYEWEGDSNVGKGRIEIVESAPPRKVALSLNMIKPFECLNEVVFTLEPDGETTTVTWAMDGPSLYIAKVMGLFVDMDKMVGGDFEAGLASLKRLAER